MLDDALASVLAVIMTNAQWFLPVRTGLSGLWWLLLLVAIGAPGAVRPMTGDAA
jgi:hypothetical protein